MQAPGQNLYFVLLTQKRKTKNNSSKSVVLGEQQAGVNAVGADMNPKMFAYTQQLPSLKNEFERLNFRDEL